MLPIGVLIPTRNSMALVSRHVETMRPWLDLAQQIVVVDSDSRDGTLEFLRRNLPAEKTRFLTHPVGLYQSWNFGIRQITARYTYISTVGDELCPNGFEHLFSVAEKFSADVVISPPKIVCNSGKPVRSNRWPIHRIISYLSLETETCIEGLIPFVMALSFLPFALLGSSASNLYRTRTLQENPFSTEFGLNGDGAWGVTNALKIKLAISPRCVGIFRKHPKSYRRSEYATLDPDRRMLENGLRALTETMERNPAIKAQAALLGVDDFVRQKLLVQKWREELIRCRLRPGWCLRPGAWHARIRRVLAQKRCENMLRLLLTANARKKAAPSLAVAVPAP